MNTSGQFQAIAGGKKMKGKGKPKKMGMPKGKGQQKVADFAMSGPGKKMKGKAKGFMR